MTAGRRSQGLSRIIPSISTWPNKYAMPYLRSKSVIRKGKDKSRCNSNKKCNKRHLSKSKPRRDSNNNNKRKLKRVRKRKSFHLHLSRRRKESLLQWELLQAIVITQLSTKR